MRRIAHISDLHFGTEDRQIAEGLLDDLAKHPPHLVAVSGDLTQRARRGQFAAARDYLTRIDAPKLIVPGNHDLPLYNLILRGLRPLGSYQQFITRDMSPFLHDEEIAVAGVNTARPSTWKEGRISLEQIDLLRERFSSVPADSFKVLVSHHPFIPPENDNRAVVVGRCRQALKMLEACGCSLILSGHLHRAYSGDVRPHHLEISRSILVAQAGTAISKRRRDEPNAYNRITLDGEHLELEICVWDGAQFSGKGRRCFRRTPSGWVAAAG